MESMRFVHRISISCVLLSLAATHASAQEPYAILAVPIPFDFLNPGARSLALGSAFTGLADDATAAFTNPAGLVQLSRAEVSFEGRYRNLTGAFLDRGRFGGGDVTGIGMDTVQAPQNAEVTDTHFGPSFASVVVPGSTWAVAGYRHEVLKSSQSILSQGGIFHYSSGPSANSASPGMRLGDYRISAFQASRGIEIVTYGASAAVKAGTRFSVGGGVTFSQATLMGTADQLRSTGYQVATTDVQKFRYLRQYGKSHGYGVLGGVQWSNGDPIRIGVAYRRAASFAYEQEGTGRDEESCGDGTVDGVFGTPRFNSCEFRAPDVISVGVSTRPSQSWLLTFQYDRVMYSQLRDDYLRRLAEFDFSQTSFVVDDGSEFHAGVEYVFSQKPMAPALRGGVWRAPDNSVRYPGSATSPSEFVAYVMTLLPGQSPSVHGTGGLGVSVNKHFEVNAAVDVSSDLFFVTASAVVRF
jgi:long-chain fatty acid transport protein